jgi:hypothetical protein
MIRSHPMASVYSSLELVALRRMLVTAGDRIECPRCSTGLEVTSYADARDGSATSYDLLCRHCGGESVLGNLPDGLT